MKGMNEMDKKTDILFYAPLLVIIAGFILQQKLAILPNVLSTAEIIRLSVLIAFAHVAAVGDIRSKKVPNKLMLAMLAGWVVVTVVSLFLNIELTMIYLVSAGMGLLAGGGLFLLVYVISRKGLGGGDVKFMAIAGLYLTAYRTLPVMLVGTILAGLAALVLLAMKRVTYKATIPLIPFLYGGILITLFLSR